MSARPTLSRILLAFALVTVALPAAAVERGTPNSTARQGYCAGGYSDCLGAGRKDCKSKIHGLGPAGELFQRRRECLSDRLQPVRLRCDY